jgi:hypothetical protein
MALVCAEAIVLIDDNHLSRNAQLLFVTYLFATNQPKRRRHGE